jgi:hypothetical protein
MSVVFATLWFNAYDKPNCSLDGKGQRFIEDFESGEVLPYCSKQSVKRVMRDFFGVERYHSRDDLVNRYGAAMGTLVYDTLAIAKADTTAGKKKAKKGKETPDEVGEGSEEKSDEGDKKGAAVVDLDQKIHAHIEGYQKTLADQPKGDHSRFVSELLRLHREYLDVWGGVVSGDKPQNKAKIWVSQAWMVTGQGYLSDDTMSGTFQTKGDAKGSWRVTDGYWIVVFGAADGKSAEMLKQYLSSDRCQLAYAVAQRSSASRNEGSEDSDVGFGSRLVEALEVRSAALSPIADLRRQLAGVTSESDVVQKFKSWASLVPNTPSFRKVGG